jgi:gephyrin
MVEYTTVEKASADGRIEERVRIHEPVEEGENIREVGVDCKAGTLVMKKGEEITLVGGEVGILASVGLSRIAVYGRPRVGVLSSGNEVVDISQETPLRYGQVRDTNRPSLIAALRSSGFEAIDLGIASDE